MGKSNANIDIDTSDLGVPEVSGAWGDNKVECREAMVYARTGGSISFRGKVEGPGAAVST